MNQLWYLLQKKERVSVEREGRFKSYVVDADNYHLICQRYIELNPVCAGMLAEPSAYTWSRYRVNGLGQRIKRFSPNRIYCALGKITAERSTA